MYILVESNEITEIFSNPKAIKVAGITHSRDIFKLWSEAELKAIGVYTAVIDTTNLNSTAYYVNTGITYAYASGAVIGSYGTATAKDLDKLKDKDKELINREAYSALQDSDWLVVRAAEGGTAVPSTWTTYRAAVRTKSNDMETLIDAAANVDALAALYVYNEDDPPTRPLGEWPSKPE